MSYEFDNLFTFEMANNHQGRVEHGYQIVAAMAAIAKKFNIKAAVKLQYRDLDTFIHPDFRSRADVAHIPRFFSTRLSKEELQSLAQSIRDAGLITMATPFDEASVELALNHGIEILKIASCSALDWPLVGAIARSGRPVIASTGGLTLQDLDKLVTFLEHQGTKNIGLLHCVSTYPTADADQYLGIMQRMIRRYPHCTVGYSGHESPDNLNVVRSVVAMGSRILERHVGLPADGITLNAYSMNPQQTENWVEAALATREMCRGADGRKRITDAEANSLRSLMRGVYATRAISKGEVLTQDSVFFAMPCSKLQTTSGEYQNTMVASRDYAPRQAIEERRSYDVIHEVRAVVHEAKGLLRESGIPLGSDYEVELSHHYGMDRFRHIGATIVSFFNREYCKKLIILLPGQEHPMHFHKEKEETFQILYGDMFLKLEDGGRQLRAGDIELIKRCQPHAFSSESGCIFEEISTTHIRGDSYYDDPRIAQLDPMQRKTVIESW